MEFRLEILVQALFSLAAAGVYAWVATIIQQRSPSPEARRANTMFATWWLAFGLVYLLVGVYTLPVAIGYRDLALTVTMLNVLLILICVAFWGLVYYLVYLYTGSARWFWPLTAAYAAFAVGLVYLIAWMRPIGFEETALRASLVYENKLGDAASLALGLSFSLPVIAAALAYGSLYFRVDSRAARYRIAMVALAFVAWFGWSAVSALLQLSKRFPDSLALLVANNAIAVAVPLVIVLAYKPPRRMRERLGIAPEVGGS